MWITRLILVLLGLWLIRQLVRIFTLRGRNARPEVGKPSRNPSKSPFRDPSIRDAEFEEVERRGTAGEDR